VRLRHTLEIQLRIFEKVLVHNVCTFDSTPPFTPNTYTGLGAWVKEQRSLNNAGKLQEERKQKLISIGFIFDGAEAKRIREQAEGKPASSWEDKFALLEKFKEQHGHTCVPLQRHDPGLGCWVREQRSLYNSGKLQESRKERLESLGFIFDGSEAKKVREQSEGKACHSWNDKFKLLETFKEKHGHTCVPKQEAELGWWVQQCRQLYNCNKLADDKKERLEAIGFVFDGAEAKRVRDSFQGKPSGGWDDKLKLLKEFKDQNGHTCVAQKHPTLGFWVKEQRMALNKGRLSNERRRKLDEVGFTWDARRKGDGEDGSGFGLGSLDSQTSSDPCTPLGTGPVAKVVTSGAKKNTKPAGAPMAALFAQEAAMRAATAAASGAKGLLVSTTRGVGTMVVEGVTMVLTAEGEEDRKASLGFLCNPSQPGGSAEQQEWGEEDWSEHTLTVVAQLAPAHQRPDEEGVVEARTVATAVNGVLERGADGPMGAGSKRSYSEIDNATEATKLGEAHSAQRQIEVSGVAGHGGEFEQMGDAAVIAAAQEQLKTSREKCRYQLEMMRTYQQRLIHLVQINFKDGDQLMQCIPELETSRKVRRVALHCSLPL